MSSNSNAVFVVIGMPIGIIIVSPLIVLVWKLRSRRISRQLASLRIDLESSESRALQLSNLESWNAKHLRTVKSLNQQLTTLNAERENLVHDARLGRISETELDSTRTRLRHATEQCSALKAQVNHLLADRDDSSNVHSAEVARMDAEKRAEIDDLATRLGEKESECEASTARLAELQRRYDHVKQEYLQLKFQGSSNE